MKIPRPILVALILLVLIAVTAGLTFLIPSGPESRFGEIIYETQSEFSQIRVREKGSVRSLLFVDPDGTEHCQSSVDVRAPAEHQLGYTKTMLSSFFFHYPQKRVLIVGLGGGGMVQFLNFSFPAMAVEAVEIDPVVVQIAAEYFYTRPGIQFRVHTEDAFEFFEREHRLYDVIYMDAFLQPAVDSGHEEKTQRLKTLEFLTKLQSHLVPDGLVAFNVIPARPATTPYLEAIAEAFPSTYTFDVPGTGNRIVIACKTEITLTRDEIRERAQQLDTTLGLDFSFEEISNSLKIP